MKEVIIKWPSTIEERDDLGWTPLHIAAQLGKEKYVKPLLENGNSPAYEKNNEGLSAIHIASKKGNVNVMKELITICPDIYEFLDLKGQTALHVAAESGKREAVKFFLERPEFMSLINKQDKEGNTPMHLAAINGHIEIACLLRQGTVVDLNATNKGGYTAMDNVMLRMKLKQSYPTVCPLFLTLLNVVLISYSDVKNQSIKSKHHNIQLTLSLSLSLSLSLYIYIYIVRIIVRATYCYRIIFK